MGLRDPLTKLADVSQADGAVLLSIDSPAEGKRVEVHISNPNPLNDAYQAVTFQVVDVGAADITWQGIPLSRLPPDSTGKLTLLCLDPALAKFIGTWEPSEPRYMDEGAADLLIWSFDPGLPAYRRFTMEANVAVSFGTVVPGGFFTVQIDVDEFGPYDLDIPTDTPVWFAGAAPTNPVPLAASTSYMLSAQVGRDADGGLTINMSIVELFELMSSGS